MRRLLVALETDCRDIWDSLRRQIARVTRLAPLSLEPSLIIANRLAETPLRFAAGSDGRHSNTSDLAVIEKRIEQITSALELHARLCRALREFDRQIVAVIGARPDHILAQRQAATEIWETLESLRSRALELTQIPVSCAEIDQIEQRFLAAEDAWIELAQEGRTVKAMVARLDSLIEQYSAICAQGRDLKARLESQVAQFRLAWDRFALWRRRLQRYRDQHLNDHQLVAAINSRLAELETSVARLRENYAEAPPTIDRARQEIDRILRESYRDVEFSRGGRMEKVPAQTIAPVES
jgi:DNA repair exonuclease SbcCD ATPase subunit